MHMRRRFLFLCSLSPWQPRAQAALDLLMTAAVLDQDVHLCFVGTGVLQLVPEQDGAGLGLKTLARQLPALELYGVTQCYAERAALEHYALQDAELLLPVTLLDAQQLAALVQACEVVEHCR
jgi:tRNA 2-thiouridine synthesizing protein C